MTRWSRSSCAPTTDPKARLPPLRTPPPSPTSTRSFRNSPATSLKPSPPSETRSTSIHLLPPKLMPLPGNLPGEVSFATSLSSTPEANSPRNSCQTSASIMIHCPSGPRKLMSPEVFIFTSSFLFGCCGKVRSFVRLESLKVLTCE